LEAFGGQRPDSLIGSTVKDKAPISTTLLPGAAHFRGNAWWDKDVVMTISVPAGTRALSMDPYSTVKGQHELLLGDSTEMKITGAKLVNGKWHVDAEVMSDLASPQGGPVERPGRTPGGVVVDTPRVPMQDGGMTSTTDIPGGPADLQVTESSKGRTTKVRLPDGSVAQRTSKTRAYTHAVVITEDNHAHAAEVQALIDRRKAFIDALEAWVARGSDISELKAYNSATLSMAERERGRSKRELYLPGFEPVQKTIKASRYAGSGGKYWADEHGFSLPDPADRLPYSRPFSDEDNGKTPWEVYGPAFVLKNQRGAIEHEQAEVDKLRAQPQYSYDVWRWSSSFSGAMGYANQVDGGEYSKPWRTAKTVGAGTDVTETRKPKGPTAEEKAAAKELRDAADKLRREQSDVELVQRWTDSIRNNTATGQTVEEVARGVYLNDKGLLFLARQVGINPPAGWQRDKDALRRAIVEKVLGRLLSDLRYWSTDELRAEARRLVGGSTSVSGRTRADLINLIEMNTPRGGR
jgi:hypothetical protein